MIIKIFRHGKDKANNAINYLFSEKCHENFKPQLFKGNAKLTRNIVNSLTNKYKYVSGVISFRENENLTYLQKLELVKEFEKTVAPFKEQDRTNFLWVEHNDKNRLELHFICPRIDLKTLKAFNINPPGQQNKELYRCFTELQNFKFKFKPVQKNLVFNQLNIFTLKNTLDDLVEKRAKYIEDYYDNNTYLKNKGSKKYGKNRTFGKQNREFRGDAVINKRSNTTSKFYKGANNEIADRSIKCNSIHKSKGYTTENNIEFSRAKNQLPDAIDRSNTDTNNTKP